MNNWTSEDWKAWAEATTAGRYLLENYEKVVELPPSTPEEKARFEALMQTLQERFGVKCDG
ncbi:hypothetical protein D3C76_1104130 [compost metagenome]